MNKLSSEVLVREQFTEAVRARIAEYEKRTSVEFVPVIVRESGDYGVYRGRLGLATTIAVLLAFSFFHHPLAWALETLIALGAGLALTAVAAWRPLYRRLVPAAVMSAAVEEDAALQFLTEEIFDTRSRTGVLIFISLFEHAVFLIADKGLTAKVPQEEWRTLGRRLATDFNHGTPGAVFLQALDEVMARLESDFPPEGGNPNELPDEVRQR